MFSLKNSIMALDMRVISISLSVIFLAVFVLFYIFDNLSHLMMTCSSNEKPKLCTSSLPLILLVLLLIAGGLITVINITVYIVLSSMERV